MERPFSKKLFEVIIPYLETITLTKILILSWSILRKMKHKFKGGRYQMSFNGLYVFKLAEGFGSVQMQKVKHMHK